MSQKQLMEKVGPQMSFDKDTLMLLRIRYTYIHTYTRIKRALRARSGLQHDTTGLYYGIIVQDYITGCHGGIILRDYIARLYNRVIIQDEITELYYGIMLWYSSTE